MPRVKGWGYGRIEIQYSGIAQSLPVQLRIGEILELEIDRMAFFSGQGIARLDGLLILCSHPSGGEVIICLVTFPYLGA